MTINAASVTRAAPSGPIRSGAILTVLLVGQFMAILDVSVTNVAAPTIRIDLHTSGAVLQLVVAGYTISYAVLLVTVPGWATGGATAGHFAPGSPCSRLPRWHADSPRMRPRWCCSGSCRASAPR
jgi:MFS family permease